MIEQKYQTHKQIFFGAPQSYVANMCFSSLHSFRLAHQGPVRAITILKYGTMLVKRVSDRKCCPTRLIVDRQSSLWICVFCHVVCMPCLCIDELCCCWLCSYQTHRHS